VQQRLDEICGVATQAIDDVRQIIHDLRPYQLDTLGLTQAIRAVIKRASENSAIQFESGVDEMEGALNPDSEIHVYRIVQECLNNVIKHSGATEARVEVKRQPAFVSIQVWDNGRGFEASQASAAGFGLSSISERAHILGGQFTAESQPGRGTQLTISIPSLPIPT
jgi:two-component system, sensor histidine kinase LadS